MVYLIHNTEHNICKIGYSGNPLVRMANLQTATPYKLRLAGTLPGGKAEEQELHGLFDGQRINGEWFHASDELFNAFDEIPGEDDYEPTAVKISVDAAALFFKFSLTATRMFGYVMSSMSLNTPTVRLVPKEAMEMLKMKQRASFYNGINELMYYGFIAKSDKKGCFHTNSAWIYKGLQIKAKHKFPELASVLKMPSYK